MVSIHCRRERMPSTGEKKLEQQRARRAAARAAATTSVTSSAVVGVAAATTKKEVGTPSVQEGARGISVITNVDELLTSTDACVHEQRWRGGVNRQAQLDAYAHQVAASQAAAAKRAQSGGASSTSTLTSNAEKA